MEKKGSPDSSFSFAYGEGKDAYVGHVPRSLNPWAKYEQGFSSRLKEEWYAGWDEMHQRELEERERKERGRG